MKTHLHNFLFVLTGAFLIGCTGAVNDSTSGGEDPSGEDASAASGECAEDKACKKMCGEIFKHREAKNKCLQDLPVRQVKLLKEVNDTFSKPSEKKLKKIDSDQLSVLLGLSVRPLERWMSNLSEAEAKKVLVYFAGNEKIIEIVQGADDEFKALKALLSKIDSDEDSALSASIGKGKNFIETAMAEENNQALNYIHEFFEADCSDNSHYTQCIFQGHYCDLNIDTGAADSYFGYAPFESLLTKVLEDHRPQTNAPSWWQANTDIGDLDSWNTSPNDVCNSAEF